ncbi:MAG: pseudouridine synthase [Rhodanobacter sp.]
MPRPPLPRSVRTASTREPVAPRHGLARVLSKLGACSRSEAEQWVRAGRVSVDGRVVVDPYRPTLIDRQQVAVDGELVKSSERVYVAFNKPRGLVVSAADEHGRATVYTALAEAGLPWLGPVGRLDKASEGLLLLSNDTVWASCITDPASHLQKTYHVQVCGQPDAAVLAAMQSGIVDGGDTLRAQRATMLRAGTKNAWLEVVLDEGRNRHIRRLMAALGFDVLRLIRVAVGPLQLGDMGKGHWRRLSADEVRVLAPSSGS